MRKKFKIIYLILFIIVLFISAVSIFLFKNKNPKVEIAKNETNIVDSNSIIAVDETTDTNNEIIENVIDSTTTEPSIELENIEQESSQEKVQEKTQTTTNNKTQSQSQPKPVQEKKTVSGTVQKQETVVTNTKEKISQAETSTPVETTPKQENNQTNTNNDAKNDTKKDTQNDTQNNTTTKDETTSTNPVDTIKRISDEDLQAEKAKYLNDIQSIKPGLKYKEAKRGQVFWPYRTTEIEIAVGGVSFGTVYYYVDVFVEGNQEKFKYYIDWTGE